MGCIKKKSLAARNYDQYDQRRKRQELLDPETGAVLIEDESDAEYVARMAAMMDAHNQAQQSQRVGPPPLPTRTKKDSPKPKSDTIVPPRSRQKIHLGPTGQPETDREQADRMMHEYNARGGKHVTVDSAGDATKEMVFDDEISVKKPVRRKSVEEGAWENLDRAERTRTQRIKNREESDAAEIKEVEKGVFRQPGNCVNHPDLESRFVLTHHGVMPGRKRLELCHQCAAKFEKRPVDKKISEKHNVTCTNEELHEGLKGTISRTSPFASFLLEHGGVYGPTPIPICNYCSTAVRMKGVGGSDRSDLLGADVPMYERVSKDSDLTIQERHSRKFADKQRVRAEAEIAQLRKLVEKLQEKETARLKAVKTRKQNKKKSPSPALKFRHDTDQSEEIQTPPPPRRKMVINKKKDE